MFQQLLSAYKKKSVFDIFSTYLYVVVLQEDVILSVCGSYGSLFFSYSKLNQYLGLILVLGEQMPY